MTIEPATFQAHAESFDHKMKAAILLNRGIAYDGRIADTDCIVYGFTEDPENPLHEVNPLAIVITPEIFEVLEVDATKFAGEDEEQGRPAWTRQVELPGGGGMFFARFVPRQVRGGELVANTITMEAEVDIDGGGNILGIGLTWLDALPIPDPESPFAYRGREHVHEWQGGGHGEPEMCKLCWRDRGEVPIDQGGWGTGTDA